MDKDIEFRADRILAENLPIIEWKWLEAGGRGMGRRYILAVERRRPDDITFAFVPTPWSSFMETIRPWRDTEVVIMFSMVDGIVIRTIPAPEPS